MGFLDGGFCVAGALPVGASFPPGYYWRRACHGPPLCGPFFWPVLAFCWLWLLWVTGAAAPVLAHLASLAFLPGSGRAWVFWPLRLSWPFALLSWAVRSGMALRCPSSLPLPFGLCVGLCLLLFCFGLCGLAWPSGGLFVCAATVGDGLPLVWVGCAALWGFGWWWH